MPSVNQWSLTTAISNMVASAQSAAKVLLDFTVGSVNLAIIEAVAQVVVWLEGLILILLATTRAASSNGADLDSFMLDFGVTRLPAVAATGQVTFSRFTPTYQAVVPVGAVVQTTDGTQQFQVIVDTTNSAYSAPLGGFVIAAGIGSVNVTVQAITNGPSGVPDASGNVAAGSISALSQAIQYVDTVTNATAFTNGANPETDAALRTRFVAYINSLSKATKAAVSAAITGVQQGVTDTLVENVTYAGVPQVGLFYAVVDDGTGHPSSTLLNNVGTAIEAVRPIGVTYASPYAPSVVNATVVMTIVTAAGYNHSTLTGLVQTAIQNYINSLPLGTSLAYSRLSQLAYDASPGVTNVTGVTLNGGTADITATAQQVIKYASVTVS